MYFFSLSLSLSLFFLIRHIDFLFHFVRAHQSILLASEGTLLLLQDNAVFVV
jgi:hypothetical protein